MRFRLFSKMVTDCLAADLARSAALVLRVKPDQAGRSVRQTFHQSDQRRARRREAALQSHLQTCCRFDVKRELSHEMHQAVVCRHLRTLSSASVLESWKTQCARCRSRLWYLG